MDQLELSPIEWRSKASVSRLAPAHKRFMNLRVIPLLGVVALAAGVPSLRAQEAAVSPAPASAPSFAEFDFSYVVRVPPPENSRKVRVWVPLPSSDQYQTISQLDLTGPVKVQLHRETKYGDRYGYFEVDSSKVKAGFSIRLAFHVIRSERRANLAASGSSQKSFPKTVEPFLEADDLVPTGGLIQTLAREQTRGLTDPVQKARKIYDYVISAMSQDARDAGAGRGDALWAADSHRGDCTDFHSLFIAMARAAGIPARFAIGFSLPDGQEKGTVSGYRSWAEFYVTGHGWIPVDLWQAAQDPSRRDYFFGGLDAHRVLISLGRDVALAPFPQAGRLNYIAYPYFEADGKPSPVASMDFFFNVSGLQSPPTIFRKLIFASTFDGHRVAS